MEHSVFIHTNPKQMLGALLAQFALQRHSQHGDKFAIRIINTKDYPFLAEHEGKTYLRDRIKRVWLNDDLQSFTPLRFMPPELMGYRGRAIVIDPDVFAVGDVWELLTRDMEGKAILCRSKGGRKGRYGCMASSVMLLDCARLAHWRCERQFKEMFQFERDYMDWVCLKLEPGETIGLFENEWNDFDHLTDKTKMLHNTKRKTQPWKTGLPVDFRPPETLSFIPPRGWIKRARRALFGEYGLLGHYKRHPDPNQERFFFGLLRAAMAEGVVSEQFVRDEMGKNHVRHDALELVERVLPLPAV